MKAGLVKNILIQIEACVRDRARSFSVKDVKNEESRATTYRYINALMEKGVLKRMGKKYTVSDEFREELLKTLSKM